jgi:DNA gyrase subunit A
LAISENRPRVLPLLDVVTQFLDFRRDVVRRRTAFELEKAEARDHVLEGFVKALDHLDAVIELIRAAGTPAEAREQLMERFEFSEIQAQAILDLQLHRLTGMEREKITKEHEEIQKLVAELRSILASEQRIKEIVRRELEEVKGKFGDPRRTEIVAKTREIRVEDMIAEEDMVITVSHLGYIKRSPVSVYRKQKRGGKGRIGMRTREEDFVGSLFIASTHDYILIFTDRGRVYWCKVHEIPEVGSAGKGKAIVNLVSMSAKEKLAAVCPVKEFPEDLHVFMATRSGRVKKTPLSAFANPMSRGIIAIGIGEEDSLIAAAVMGPKDEVVLATHNGLAIRFAESEVRPMGRTASGVKGIELRKGDHVVGMAVVEEDGTLLTVTEKGYGKRTALEQYRLQSRGGKGIINIKTTSRNGPVVGVRFVGEEDEVMVVTGQGMILRLKVEGIGVHGRATQGVRLIDVDEGDQVVAVAKLAEKQDEGDGETPKNAESDG